MFRHAAKFIKQNAYRLMLASSAATFTILSKNIRTQSDPQANLQNFELHRQKVLEQHQAFSKIIEVQVCEAKLLREGQVFCFDISQQLTDGSTKSFPVLIFRYQGSLYCVGGLCTHNEPFSQTPSSMKDAIVFNDKLYCPHHGCAYNITSGSVEYGPAFFHLPKFLVKEKEGKIVLFHPSKIPKKILPKLQMRDYNDLRKVVILGGDHNAVMGCIYGLRQYDYGGQITVVQSQDDPQQPYKHELLHKNILNLKDKNKTEDDVEKLLNFQIYDKLKFEMSDWYELYGVDFMWTSEIFRIINKRYYPYLSFLDQTKVQFDGLVIAQGVHETPTPIKSLDQLYSGIKPPNVFSPYKDKNEHRKMCKFFNMNPVKNLLVVGLNTQSLQFCNEVIKKFPQIKIRVIDTEKQNKFSQMYGPPVASAVLKDFKNSGVQFYVQILKTPNTVNRIDIQDKFKPNTISVQLDQDTYLKADAAVVFSNEFKGNNKCIHNGKFTDIDFTRIGDRVIGDFYCRTDTKRLFTIGAGSSNNYFFTGLKIQSNNTNFAYEQGFTAAFNLLALKIPFHYIPFESQQYFDKKILYCGSRIPFESMYILGSVENWDFIALYALDDIIVGTSASPSKQKEFQVIRESFRLGITPELPQFIEGTTNIAKLYMDIKKNGKSACYKDQIHFITDEGNVPDVLWMQRGDTMAKRERGIQLENESSVEVDQKGYVREL